MSINLHIENIGGGEIANKNPDNIISPLSSQPTSPKIIDKPNEKKKHLRIGQKKEVDSNTIISYKFFKNFIYPNMINDKKQKKFLYKKQLQNTLDSLKIKYNKNEKKEVLQQLLFDTYNMVLEHDTPIKISKINFLKKSIASYIKIKREKIYGPGFADKSLCKNQEDCFTLESIYNIPDKYFFSVKDSYNSVFFFDVRTFKKLIDKKSDNPYNREQFTPESLETFELRKEHMIRNNISILYAEEEEYLKNLTPGEKIHNKLLDIFGEIDSLNVVASGTRLEWFNNLNIVQLKKLYRVLEDVWNYRAELSNSKKLEIVPQNNMFPNSVNYIFNITNKIQLQNLLLNEMEKLVKSSPIEAHRHTGAYYVLISLTEISYQCAQDLPWLIQY